jgi:Core-2/I-Branching enzyme
MKKLAFCFLIYDIINNEDLWKIFFKNVDEDKYNIYIHYKSNKELKYFEKYKLENCIETKYADVTLIHAHNLLFKKAYEDGCYKIISLSQACVPFKSFDYIYNFLINDDYGHFNITPQSQCFPRCNSLLEYYDKSFIQKSSNWFILNREMCELIVYYDKNMIDKEYGNITSPEEHYFITMIFKHNLQDSVIKTLNLSNDSTTFTNWAGMDYKYPTERGLKNYSFIRDEEILYLLNSKCLFGRKFNSECIISFAKDEYFNFISSN